MVRVKNVSIRYLAGDLTDIGLKEWTLQKLKRQRRVEGITAVKNVSFSLEKGDFLGVIGSNGAGKSTLLKSVTGILPQLSGEIVTEGNLVALLELGTGFDGDLNLRENILMRGALLGYTKEFIEERIDEILEFAELVDFQWYKYKQLSSGMKSRLAFSICCMVEPDILILDEVLSVGDGGFRKKSSDKMLEIIKGGAVTLYVGHSLQTMKDLANKILWLDHGNQVAFAETREEAREILRLYELYLKQRATNPALVPNLEELRKVPKPRKKCPPKTVPAAQLEQMEKNNAAVQKRLRLYLDFAGQIAVCPEKIQCMKEYFAQRSITHVALYGDNAVVKVVAELLKQAEITIDYVIENEKKSSYSDTVIPRSAERYPDTQMIVITDLYFENKLIEKLSAAQYPFCTLNEVFNLR